MKIKIPVKYIDRINNLRQMNISFNSLIDDMINDLGRTLELSTPEEQEILWDHILNGSTWTVEYQDDNIEHLD